MAFLEKAAGFLRTTFENYELVCVDDDCTDNTIPLLKEYVSEHYPTDTVTIVKMGIYQGEEAAMNAGRDLSIGDFVFEFDTPFVDYGNDILLQAYEISQSGTDIVTVSPENGLRLSSRLFYGLFNRFSKNGVKLSSETFRIISRRAINRIKAVNDYIPYRKAVYANCGLSSSNIKYHANRTRTAKPRKQSYERFQLAFDSFIYFTDFLEKLSTFISAFFLLFSVGSVTYALWDYFANGTVIEGWTSTICFLSFSFFGVFVLLTFILKYLAVLLHLIFKRQKYIVSSVEKSGGSK